MNYYNFDIEKELLEQNGTEWLFGGLSQPSIVSIPQSERAAYLPAGETQATNTSDTYDCATRGPINVYASLYTYGYQKKIFSAENRKWLEENGYVKDGKIDFSDRFIAILSGTTRKGNSLKAPLDCIHNKGLIPKWMFPLDKSLTFEQYYDSSKITQGMLDLGEEFIRRFENNYEQVYPVHFGEVLKDDYIDVAAYAWPTPVNGVYHRTNWPMNHCFVLWNVPKFLAFDNYEESPGDFIKQLAPDYNFFNYGYRPYIGKETVINPANPVDTAVKIAKLQQLLQLLIKYRDLLLQQSIALGRRVLGIKN